MSMLMYSVRAECCACGQIQDVEVSLPDYYSDDDVEQALDHGAACLKCRSVYWSPLRHPEKWVKA